MRATKGEEQIIEGSPDLIPAAEIRSVFIPRVLPTTDRKSFRFEVMRDVNPSNSAANAWRIYDGLKDCFLDKRYGNDRGPAQFVAESLNGIDALSFSDLGETIERLRLDIEDLEGHVRRLSDYKRDVERVSNGRKPEVQE